MNNLIRNSRWQPGPNGGPMYFSGDGSTYDMLYINGYRTCSITRSEDDMTFTSDNYDPMVMVSNQRGICWGYMIRAAEAAQVLLVAEFYDQDENMIHTARHPISVAYNFAFRMSRFRIPSNAYGVKLSMVFSGTVTACTYFAPTAYFC